MTYFVAISNEKGGVAKTTTTLSLGAALAEKGMRVLLTDLDPQGNLSLAVGIEPRDAQNTSSDILLKSLPLLRAIHKTNTPLLDIIPAAGGMEQEEEILAMRSGYEHILRNAFQDFTPLPYNFVLLDCPPSLGAITRNALTAANLLIIPTQAEFFSAYALRDMMELIRDIRSANNPALAYRILITLLDQRNRSHRVIREQLQQTFGTGLFETVIEIDTRLRESPIIGMPITQYKPNSRGSQQYRVLAQELINYVEKANQQSA
jgi:chromosome partitioning protein